jgi:hypothetical protein
MMRKGYICREERRENTEEFILDYSFDSKPENAMFWETREEAEGACIIFNDRVIMVPSGEGGKYRCTDFKVEQRKPNEFIVFCEAPFIPRQTSNQFVIKSA